MNDFLTDPYEIAAYIKNATKKTPVKALVKGAFVESDFEGCLLFSGYRYAIVYGESDLILAHLKRLNVDMSGVVFEVDRRNSAIPLLDIKELNARIEPGAIIRDHVHIGDNVVIMMGALINIGASIGDKTMIDMGAIVGARGTIGKNCHIGAGAVIAGVLEPPSKTPVIIEDDVLIGANAVVLEGVRVGQGSVVAAGAIVTEDVPAGVVVAGAPAKIIKTKDDKTASKTQILDDLRQ